MFILPSLVGLFFAGIACAHPLAGVESATVELARRTTITKPGNGTAYGYFYYLYAQNGGGVVMDVGIGNYSLTYTSAAQEFIAGIGRNPGNTNPITYSSNFNPVGNAYLSVYGLTTNPDVEYWICEKFGSYNPSTGYTYKGTVSSDGSIYDIYKTVRVGLPVGGGPAILNQYVSVRRSQRVGGTVTLANHFNAWKSLNMTMGSFTFQIVATEGYLSSGSSQVSVQI